MISYQESTTGKNELITNLEKLHTTELGTVRIKKNLCLHSTTDAVSWCRDKIKSQDSKIRRSGKNWYVTTDCCIITVNASSYTIITAHKQKSSED